MDQLEGIGGFKGKVTGKQFIQRCAQRIKIRAPVNRSVHSSGLFGRHIRQGSGQHLGFTHRSGTRQGPRRTEVNNLKVVGLGIENNIGWLDVPVNEIGGVNFPQNADGVNSHFQQLPQGKRMGFQQLF